MSARNSKANADTDFFNRRIDEIRMSSHERLKAKARLAQAEAIADALAAAVHRIARLFRSITAKPERPSGRSAPSAG